MILQQDILVREEQRKQWLAEAQQQRLTRQAVKLENPRVSLMLIRAAKTLAQWGSILQTKYRTLVKSPTIQPSQGLGQSCTASTGGAKWSVSADK